MNFKVKEKPDYINELGKMLGYMEQDEKKEDDKKNEKEGYSVDEKIDFNITNVTKLGATFSCKFSSSSGDFRYKAELNFRNGKLNIIDENKSVEGEPIFVDSATDRGMILGHIVLNLIKSSLLVERDISVDIGLNTVKRKMSEIEKLILNKRKKEVTKEEEKEEKKEEGKETKKTLKEREAALEKKELKEKEEK